MWHRLPMLALTIRLRLDSSAHDHRAVRFHPHRELRQRGADYAVQLADPLRRGLVEDRAAGAEIVRRDDDGDGLMARVRRGRERRFDRRRAEGAGAGLDGPAVEEDVAAGV